MNTESLSLIFAVVNLNKLDFGPSGWPNTPTSLMDFFTSQQSKVILINGL